MSVGVPGDRNRFAEKLFSDLPARYDRLAEWLSFGQNSRWRRAMVDHIVPGSPRRVTTRVGDRRRSAPAGGPHELNVVGVDLTLSMLKMGQRNVAQAHQVRRIQLVNGRAEALPFPDAAFDALTFTYLFRYVDDPQATLNELAHVVRPGGLVASPSSLCLPMASGAGGGGPTRVLCCRSAGSRRRHGVVPGGTFPRPEHLEAVSAVSRCLDG